MGGGPHSKDERILGSMLGCPYFQKLPHISVALNGMMSGKNARVVSLSPEGGMGGIRVYHTDLEKSTPKVPKT